MLRFRPFYPLLAAALCLAGPAMSQKTYVLTDIAARTTGNSGSTIQINSQGEVSGTTVDTSGNSRAFVWTPAVANATTGTLTYLGGPMGTTTSQAYGINNLGQVVGSLGGSTIVRHKSQGFSYNVLWQPSGAIITTLPGLPFGINDSSEVVGQGSNGLSYLWINGAGSVLPGGRGVGINKGGQAACWNANIPSSGYLWTPSSLNGTTGTYIALPFVPAAINDKGEVFGNGYLYSAGAVANIGISGSLTDGGGINNSTQVVASHYLWDGTNGAQDLNDPSRFTLVNGSGWSLAFLDGINDYGQIVGFGTNAAGQWRLFLLTPQ